MLEKENFLENLVYLKNYFLMNNGEFFQIIIEES